MWRDLQIRRDDPRRARAAAAILAAFGADVSGGGCDYRAWPEVWSTRDDDSTGTVECWSFVGGYAALFVGARLVRLTDSFYPPGAADYGPRNRVLVWTRPKP